MISTADFLHSSADSAKAIREFARSLGKDFGATSIHLCMNFNAKI